MIGSPAGLWSFAIGGSVVLHGAVGMALYATPMPETKKPARTEIDIASLDTGAATRRAPPETLSSVRAERSAVIVRPVALRSAPEPAAPVSIAQPSPTDLRQVVTSTGLQPVKAAEATRIEAGEEVAAAASKTEIEPTGSDAEQIAPRVVEAGSVSPTVAAAPAAAAQPTQATATVPAEAKPLAPTVPASAQPTAETRVAGTIRPVAIDASPPAPAEMTVASVETATPSITVGIAVAPRPADTASTQNTAVVPRENASPVMQSPAAVVSTASPPMRNSSAATTASTVLEPAPTRPAESVPAVPAAAASPITISGKAAATVVAALPHPDGGGSAPTSGRLRIADFLAEREGSDCLLALPTGMGSTQASIQAFAAAPEAVDRLGADYERLSGMSLNADMRPVSQQQCSALAFARSLAQYPNFPLRVSLTEPTIRSGRALSGVISGLRKDTLYLMVVDDEGKAELVVSYPNQRASVMNFSAPMTLTSGPVSSVQLLVAIASDGPLRTVPTRPGMPAEEYFSRLATEIIAGNRSIAYGITSFVVH